MYPIDSFQDHLTWFYHCVPNWLLSRPFDQFYHCVPNWLLSRPFDPILSLCTLLTPFKTIWPNFIIVYPIDSFQDHLTQFYHCVPNWLLSRPFDQFYHCVPNWLLSRPFDLILSLCTQLTPFKTIWPDFIIVYPIDSFQDHLTQFYHCVPKLLWPLIFSSTILTFQDHFIIVYPIDSLTPIDSFQDHFQLTPLHLYP